MSAFLKLHREILSRRNLAVLQEVMQSGRASLLQKQEAECRSLRIQLDMAERRRDELRLDNTELEVQEERLLRRNNYLANLVQSAVVEQRRVNTNLKELVDNYWALIDDCFDVDYETKENARGQKRKLPAAEQLKKMKKIVIEHNDKRARMFVDAMASGAGSSTD